MGLSPVAPFLFSSLLRQFSSVLSLVPLFAIPWTAAHHISVLTISLSLLKLMLIKSVMPSNHLILGFPLLILPSIFPSIRVFSNKLTLHIRCPKYWSFSFSISPSNECSRLISFKIDWFDFPAVQGTLKESSPTQLEASILLHSAFFMVQLSHPYMTIGKKHSFDYTDLCRQSNVSAF